ncbi:MAG: serine/threonine-protein kinase [Terriglobales bacterium]
MVLASGTKLGPYEIVAPLGAGGMGEVYRARDTRLDRTVAIKILPSHFADDATRRQRFEREAKVVSGLNHPNICTLYDVGPHDGVDFIVMEYLEGESLAERLEKGPLPPAQVLQYGTQIASALDKAHRNGVTHRMHGRFLKTVKRSCSLRPRSEPTTPCACGRPTAHRWCAWVKDGPQIYPPTASGSLPWSNHCRPNS